jgi:integrase
MVEAIRRLLAVHLSADLATITPASIGAAARSLAISSPIQANRTLAYCRAFYAWAIDRGWVRVNAAAATPMPSSENARNRTPTWSELADIWMAAEALRPPFSIIVRLLILTGARVGDVGGMRARELDFRADGGRGIWTIPARRSGRKRDVPIPLSSSAREQIEYGLALRIGSGEIMFTTNGERPVSGWSNAKARLDRHLELYSSDGFFPPWRFQDLRRSFGLAGVQSFGFPAALVKECLGAGSTTTFDAEDRRAVFERWAEMIERAVA